MLKSIKIIAVVLFTSCATSNSLQTAKVLEKGDISTSLTTGASVVESNTRYGLLDDTDIGLRLNIFSISADVKYQLFKTEKEWFYLSTGLGVGYDAGYDAVYAARHKFGSTFFNIPLYYSLHNAENNISMYGTSKFTFDSYRGYFTENIGFKIGKKYYLLLEGSVSSVMYGEKFLDIYPSLRSNFGFMTGIGFEF